MTVTRALIGDVYVLGDPPEGSLIPLAQKAGLEPHRLRESAAQLRDLPFSSERKCMTSVRDVGGPPSTVTDVQLHAMSDADVLAAAEAGGTVFSRVNPADTMRIVTLLRDVGRVVP